MREQIIRWYQNNNHHPTDDNRFYDIVIASIGNRIEQTTFENALRDTNEDIHDEEIETIYKRYQDLYAFMNYYNNRI